MRARLSLMLVLLASILLAMPLAAQQNCAQNVQVNTDWTRTDFSKCIIDGNDILPGGPPRDGIPSIDEPRFRAVSKVKLAATTPVIEVVINGRARAYPLEVMIWHEIVNDEFEGAPIAITYCPLCNAAIVFDRRLDDRVLDFGTTGYLRHSDLLMYDRQTESWWQQYTGNAVLGQLAGKKLKTRSSGLVSFADFAAAHPKGQVLVPNHRRRRRYGATPYVGYDSAGFPHFYRGQVPSHIAPLARVVVAGNKAWSFDLLRKHRTLQSEGLTFKWSAGQTSALDARNIDESRDVGTVRVYRNGKPIDHKITFAFVVYAFEPEREIITMSK